MFNVHKHYSKTSRLTRVSSQGMEVDDPECGESDPEEDELPCNEDLSNKGAAGENVGNQEEGEEEENPQESVTVDEEDWHTCSEDEEEGDGGTPTSSNQTFHNSSRLLRKDELLDIFKAVHKGPRCKEGQLTVGLVGKNINLSRCLMDLFIVLS